VILDELSELADGVPLTAGPGTYNVGDVIDLTDQVPGTVGQDQAPVLEVRAATAITAASAGTLRFQLVDGPTGAISTASPSILARGQVHTTGTTPIAEGTLLFSVRLPSVTQRYLGLQQVSTGGAITAGTINAFLTPAAAKWKAHDAPAQG
jgi:hypothetical protein